MFNRVYRPDSKVNAVFLRVCTRNDDTRNTVFKKTDLREALSESALRVAKYFGIAVIDSVFVWPGWCTPANCSGIQHHSGERSSSRPDLRRVRRSAGTTLITDRRRGCHPMDCLG